MARCESMVAGAVRGALVMALSLVSAGCSKAQTPEGARARHGATARTATWASATTATATATATATTTASAPSVAANGEVTLTYIPHSSVKLEQIVGDIDRQTKQPTRNQTETRYGIRGFDLGYSFEHAGEAVFLFGDTLGPGGGDAIAHSRTTDPDRGLLLDFYTDARGGYLKVSPDGHKMPGFDVPVSGIDVDGRAYVACKIGHQKGASVDRTILTRFDDSAKTFTTLREVSKLPDGRFSKLSMHHQVGEASGLPAGGPFIFMWGTGEYRKSNAYFAVVPRASFESGTGTRYYAGRGPSGAPVWSEHETDAKPIVDHPTMGDLSVTWAAPLKLWVMTYDSRDPRGILFRYARVPWGPWSDAQTIYNAGRDGGLGSFIHERGSFDGLAGPVIGEGKRHPHWVQGGTYAPYVVERFTRVEGGKLQLYYLMSTWNPYVVVLMRSELKVE
jgi:hypothetical protein